jgi:C-terminal processing protease CtpA/Prc
VLAGESPAVSSGGAQDPERTDAPITEELIEIYAPAGKLGVVLDTPGDGPPTVHELRPNSVLMNELKVGDKVIAIDDVDVRRLSANKVSKIISRKMDNETRKFSIVRTIGPDDADVDKAAP